MDTIDGVKVTGTFKVLMSDVTTGIVMGVNNRQFAIGKYRNSDPNKVDWLGYYTCIGQEGLYDWEIAYDDTLSLFYRLCNSEEGRSVYLDERTCSSDAAPV